MFKLTKHISVVFYIDSNSVDIVCNAHKWTTPIEDAIYVRNTLLLDGYKQYGMLELLPADIQRQIYSYHLTSVYMLNKNIYTVCNMLLCNTSISYHELSRYAIAHPTTKLSAIIIERDRLLIVRLWNRLTQLVLNGTSYYLDTGHSGIIMDSTHFNCNILPLLSVQSMHTLYSSRTSLCRINKDYPKQQIQKVLHSIEAELYTLLQDGAVHGDVLIVVAVLELLQPQQEIWGMLTPLDRYVKSNILTNVVAIKLLQNMRRRVAKVFKQLYQ